MLIGCYSISALKCLALIFFTEFPVQEVPVLVRQQMKGNKTKSNRTITEVLGKRHTSLYCVLAHFVQCYSSSPQDESLVWSSFVNNFE